MNVPHSFEDLKLRAKVALYNAMLYYEELDNAQWPAEFLHIKTEIGSWQVPFIKQTIKEAGDCQLERELFNISGQLLTYQQDIIRVRRLLERFFELSEEYGIDILKKDFGWFPLYTNKEEEAYHLMIAASEIRDRVRSLLNTIEERREFKIRDIEAAAKRAGYQGKIRQLRQHLVKWHGDQRDEAEWLLSGSELDDFLNRYLLHKQRRGER